MAIPVAAIGVNPMHANDLDALRRHMLAEISAETVHVSGLMGKTALDERVMMAMGIRAYRTSAIQHQIIEELGQQAKQRLRRQGYPNVALKIANGYHGWSEHAPFDKVIVTAAPDLVPPPLIHQLKNGGKMVVPAGLPEAQELTLVNKDDNGRVTMREILQVQFSQLEEAEPG